MAILQVRDFPDDLHKKLAKLAEDEHRSLAQQVIVLLMQALVLSESGKQRRAKVLDAVKSSSDMKTRKKLSDPVKHLREDRDR